MQKFTAPFLFLFSLNVWASYPISASCDSTTGMSDSNVLALSLQAGFCQTYGYEAGKPECTQLVESSYQSNHLSLHGLWPNQNACGQSYGFCGVKQENNHCAYSPVELNEHIAEQLKGIMPAYKYGSCLERHEWNKHGSCQALSVNDYFALAIRLATEVDASDFGQYLTSNHGNIVSLASLKELISNVFGQDNIGKIYLGCKNGILVDIYIQLPALIPLNDSLYHLIDNAPKSYFRDGCPSKIKISDFNKSTRLAFA